MSKKRNILFLQSSSELYGSGKIILQVIRLYRNEGLNPVVLLTGPGPLADQLVEEGFIVQIKNLGILRRKYTRPSGMINRFFKNFNAFHYLNKLDKEFQFELVYSNTLAVIIGAYWASRRHLPHIWHIHEILPGPAPLVKLLGNLLDRSTKEPIVVSNAVGNHWKDRLSSAIPTVIHNGIPYDDFLHCKSDLRAELKVPDEQLIITMIGRINPGKGQLFFLKMAKELLKRNPECHFILVGDPFPGYEDIEREILAQMEQVSLQKNVSHLGFRTDIPEILTISDIFILPSVLPDSFPTVILEAMAAEKPVVATQSGGASEMIIEGETGYLIPIADVEKGVEAIGKLISSEDLRRKMGESGRERVLEEYSLEAFQKNIKNHLWRQLGKS